LEIDVFKKLLATVVIGTTLMSVQPAKADDMALAIIGGVMGGFIINEALQPRVYVSPQPYYRQEYIPPPVYYAPQPVYRQPYCRYEYYRDSWGYVYNQRVCY
jgi:hypothetical protein